MPSDRPSTAWMSWAHRLRCDGMHRDGDTRVYRPESNAWETHSLPAGWERNTMFMDEMRHFLEVARGAVRAGLHAG